jgi:molybdopterin converting factor small subunit
MKERSGNELARAVDRRMQLTIEFFGIPRMRTGVAQCRLSLKSEQATLGDALRELGQRYPHFAEDCLAGGKLATAYVANLDGERFVSEPATPLVDGSSLLILSADAGG